MVEKPKIGGVPSNIEIVGRYVIISDIFDKIREIGWVLTFNPA